MFMASINLDILSYIKQQSTPFVRIYENPLDSRAAPALARL